MGLSFTWTQLGWPEDASTDIEVTFDPAEERTLVRLEQSGFERVPNAEKYVAGYDAGWKEVLGWFAERVGAAEAEGRSHTDDWRSPMKYVLFYESADDVLAKAPTHFDAHIARGNEFHDQGSMLLYGPFGDLQREGSMAVFTSREAAEDFASGDPFVLNGVVRHWQIREWDEAFAGEDALAVVRAYHDAWTSKRFDQAVALLAGDLEVEVPIKEYPTAESFAGALEAFAAMIEHVELLSEMSADEEAMLLYDLDVQGLGQMRVAEHFTVEGGKIARIRQIHDTAALRAAGFAEPSV